jgi:hypothetical protein
MEATMKQARPLKIGSLWIFAAIAILAVGLAVLVGCTSVSDSLTGVSLDRNGPTSCVKQCNDFYAGEYDKEQKLHETNKEYCQTLSQPAKGDCLVAEDARHTAAMTALGNAKIECQNNCHRQGTGSAG